MVMPKGTKLSNETKEKMRLAHLGKKRKPHSEETKKKLSAVVMGRVGYWTGKNLTDAAKQKLRDANIGKKLSDEHKQKISESSRGKPHTELHTMRVLESRIGGFWYGNVGNAGAQYCEVWRLVRPRIIAFFGNICVECGTIIEGEDPCCHHVFYEKKACCMMDESGIFYSNLNVYGHPKDYCIGSNPNYFVTLCRNCHNKTNGIYENRRKWADHFRELIDTKYGGKCYLTPEEFKDYKRDVGLSPH